MLTMTDSDLQRTTKHISESYQQFLQANTVLWSMPAT